MAPLGLCTLALARKVITISYTPEKGVGCLRTKNTTAATTYEVIAAIVIVYKFRCQYLSKYLLIHQNLYKMVDGFIEVEMDLLI